LAVARIEAPSGNEHNDTQELLVWRKKTKRGFAKKTLSF
jgi:hypothetical protein